jgi:2-succinyl-6-hydroxy-2,4-cyclohexadiene-1-carboxylate synthase
MACEKQYPPLAHTACGSPGRPALVFLHGFLGSSEDWRDVTDALSDRFYCIAIDLPGHGRSVGRGPSAAYLFHVAIEGVAGVMQELGLRDATLVGYSMGGRVALALALWKKSPLVKAVIAESASVGIEVESERAARRIRDAGLSVELEDVPLLEFLRTWYAQPLFASLSGCPDALESLLERRLNNDGGELAKALHGMSAGVQPSLWDRLKSASVDLTFIAGGSDEKYKALAGRMAAASSRGKSVVVPGAGHNVHLEQPDAFCRIVRDRAVT